MVEIRHKSLVPATSQFSQMNELVSFIQQGSR